ncbi:hypothetical protein PPERSA_04924 [Pseudocohnilembus persalinus]|uniref:ubiquitinyl hydrolase 1 n=1 Tax=Pseudocohnilembus persalinus TaxID=266149 RepID=A0A0V0R919_PSEPJ|nr:hypothetical protein PPERSA_04924 [Pseudocohnilembus persalinus]|eukprot:KRX10757.1 hypothetical protein PPERSA_04924 [Pseudocohnilembus persalinus]
MLKEDFQLECCYNDQSNSDYQEKDQVIDINNLPDSDNDDDIQNGDKIDFIQLNFQCDYNGENNEKQNIQQKKDDINKFQSFGTYEQNILKNLQTKDIERLKQLKNPEEDNNKEKIEGFENKNEIQDKDLQKSKQIDSSNEYQQEFGMSPDICSPANLNQENSQKKPKLKNKNECFSDHIINQKQHIFHNLDDSKNSQYSLTLQKAQKLQMKSQIIQQNNNHNSINNNNNNNNNYNDNNDSLQNSQKTKDKNKKICKKDKNQNNQQNEIVLETRYCKVCFQEQPIRTKHCNQCKKCIATYDHHCPWLGLCIGEKNRQQKSQAAREQISQNHQNDTNQNQNFENNTYNNNNNYDNLQNSLKNINYNYENKNDTNKEKNNDKNKKKILFIHGYMSSGASFYKMLYKLNHDFEIYSIDLPGMGLSSRPKFNYVNFQDNLDFFIKTIEKYTEMAELDKFILVGHSFGGYISTRYAIQNPEKVEKLYLISPLGVTHRDLEDIKKIEEEQFQQKNVKTNIMKYIRDSFNQGGTLQNMSSKPHIPTQFILERWMKYWFPHEHETEDRILFQTFLHNILKLPTSSDIALNNMFYFTKLQAKEPLEKLLVDFPVDTHFYYGDRDWMCHQGAKRVHMEKARKYFNIVKNAEKGLYRHIHKLYKKIQNYKIFQENQKLRIQLLTCYYFAVSYYSLQHEIQQVQNELNQIPGINMQQINAIQVGILESRQIKDNLVSQLHQYFSEKIPKQGEYFIHENMAVYLLPMSWYKKWLKFSQNRLQIQEEQDEERQDLFGKPVKKHKKSLQQESDEDDKFIEEEIEEEEEEQGDNYPGYLDPYLLSENQDNLLIDPLPEQSYTNYVLKSNIIENKDFLFVTPFVAKKILDLFEGFMIQRFTYLANKEKQQVKIETNLLKINLIILPVQSRNQDYENVPVHTIQISHQQNIQQLKEKIKRCLEILPLYDKNILEKQFRLYKLDSSLTYDKLIYDYLRRNLNKKVDIRAQKLDDQCKIEDSQICEQDLILVEFKTDEHYVFNPIENEDTLSNKNINQSANLMLTNNNQVAQACQCCGKEEEDGQKLPIKCSCTYVKYCSSKCQDQDKSKHSKIHKEAKQGFEQISKIIDIFSIQINPQKNKLVKNRAGLVGLKNLGNTCFMNSSIQCLSNCFELTKKFLDGSFIQDFNPVNPLGTKCFLAGSYYEILVNLWQGKDRCFQPWNFKKIVGNYAPQFSGYSQQDAQELLSYLLDGLHEDLNRVKIKPFVEQIESDGRNDNKVAIQSWNNYLKRNQSLIVDNIVGQYKSTLICPTCNKISVTFDPFMQINFYYKINLLLKKNYYYIIIIIKQVYLITYTTTYPYDRIQILLYISQSQKHSQVGQNKY